MKIQKWSFKLGMLIGKVKHEHPTSPSVDELSLFFELQTGEYWQRIFPRMPEKNRFDDLKVGIDVKRREKGKPSKMVYVGLPCDFPYLAGLMRWDKTEFQLEFYYLL